MIDIKKIQEIVGIAAPRYDPNPIQQNIPGPAPPPRQTVPPQYVQHQHVPNPNSVTLSKCNQLYPWQQTIVNAIRGRTDYCLDARPGAGKTLPIMCYWVNNILNVDVINNIQDLDTQHLWLTQFFNRRNNDKIVWAVPLIQLTINMASEFKKNILELFEGYWFMKNGQNQNYPNPFGNPYDKNIFDRTIETFLSKNISVLYDGSDQIYNTSPDNNIIIGVYESLTKLFRNQNFVRNTRLLVLDEVHEFFQKDESDDRFANKMLFLDTALNAIRNSNCRLVVLSGTLSPQSADQMVTYLNNNYNRNFSTHTIVQPGKNQAEIKVLEHSRLNDLYEQVKIMKNAVIKKDWGVALILFSTRKIQEVANMLIKQLPYIGLSSIQNKQSSPFTSTGTGMFNKNKVQFGPSNISQIDHTAVPGSIDFTQQYISLKTLGAEDLQNQLLRDCVSRGFAFMYRGKEELGGEISGNDKIIVENLFRQRKLHAILATDSIGVGVNIDIQKLYLTNVSKYGGPSRGQTEIPLSDLSQLLNRVGRSATGVGLVFTERDNIDRVVEALSATPDKFDISDFRMPNITLLKLKNYFKNKKELYTNIYNNVSNRF